MTAPGGPTSRCLCSMPRAVVSRTSSACPLRGWETAVSARGAATQALCRLFIPPSPLAHVIAPTAPLAVTACVFVVTDKVTGALRACKLAERRPQGHTWARLCELMRHESALLQEIGYHPNVVRWEGCFFSCNRVAIVMELVGGGDCQQLLQRHGALAEEAVQAMILQLHAALRCAHSPSRTLEQPSLSLPLSLSDVSL